MAAPKGGVGIPESRFVHLSLAASKRSARFAVMEVGGGVVGGTKLSWTRGAPSRLSGTAWRRPRTAESGRGLAEEEGGGDSVPSHRPAAHRSPRCAFALCIDIYRNAQIGAAGRPPQTPPLSPPLYPIRAAQRSLGREVVGGRVEVTLRQSCGCASPSRAVRCPPPPQPPHSHEVGGPAAMCAASAGGGGEQSGGGYFGQVGPGLCFLGTV